MSTPESGPPKRRRAARSGQSIIGFTEAELGLFLALLFFGLSQLGKSGEPTVPRVRATVDSTSIRNPRLTQLLALARRLDSLDRAVRAAFARDSALAARLAQLQRERDSLRALRLGPVPGDVGGGTRAVSARPTVTPTIAPSREISSRLTAVEREIAVSQLSRSESSVALAAASTRADVTRRQLDSLAPSVSQLIAPSRALDASAIALASSTSPANSSAATSIASASAASVAALSRAAASNAAANAALSGASTPIAAMTPAAAAAARLAAAAIPFSATPRDTMAVLRALAAATVPPSATAASLAAATQTGAPGSPGSPGLPGSGMGDPTGQGGMVGGTGVTRAIGTGIGNGSGTGGGATGPGRSRQTPTCIELKVDTGSVAEVLIVAADRYTVRGRSGPLDTLLRAMQPELATARRNQCRHNVRIRTAPQLAVDDYILALNALLPYFNTELARSSGSR